MRSIAFVAVAVLALAACTNGVPTPQKFTVPQPTPFTTVARATSINIGDDCNFVLSFPGKASGSYPPTADVNGAATDLSSPFGAFTDTSGNTWIANQGGSVTEYPAGATGNVAPSVYIHGALTTFAEPVGIYVSNGTIYVTDFTNNAVDIFAPGSNGNVAPTTRIVGAATDLKFPEGIVVDSTGKVYVVDRNTPGTIDEFAGFTSGMVDNVAPVTTISYAGLTFPGLMTLDHAGNIWVTNQTGASAVYEFARNASGASIPLTTITGVNTGFGDPAGIAIDNLDYIYVADALAVAVDVFPPTASGNVAPSQVISGASTDLCAPLGVGLTEP